MNNISVIGTNQTKFTARVALGKHIVPVLDILATCRNTTLQSEVTGLVHDLGAPLSAATIGSPATVSASVAEVESFVTKLQDVLADMEIADTETANYLSVP
jgi:glutamine synthetase type III